MVGLLQTVNEVYRRVAMHAVSVELLEAQAMAVEMPLWKIPIPRPCSSKGYEASMRTAIELVIRFQRLRSRYIFAQAKKI